MFLLEHHPVADPDPCARLTDSSNFAALSPKGGITGSGFQLGKFKSICVNCVLKTTHFHVG